MLSYSRDKLFNTDCSTWNNGIQVGRVGYRRQLLTTKTIIVMKKVDNTKTLAYAVAFHFSNDEKDIHLLGR